MKIIETLHKLIIPLVLKVAFFNASQEQGFTD